MKKNKLNQIAGSACVLGLAATATTVLTPTTAHACACGCGVFDVATSSMFPTDSGLTAFVNYAYQNQNNNWNGKSAAAAKNNDDKKIETSFITPGAQYMFNRSWGAMVEIPVVDRTFDSAGNPGPVTWTGLGDIRIEGIYTGFSEDLSSGVTFGAKLPTGSDNQAEEDRDTQIGSGSTDLLLGAFHRDRFGTSHWNWFGQASLDLPVLKQGGYLPGLEVDSAAGIYYDGFSIDRVKISPVAQVIGSWRGRDNGSQAAPDDSGYQRVLLSPGVEFHLHPVKFYADVEIPVYQNMTGNQLVAPMLFKAGLSYMF